MFDVRPVHSSPLLLLLASGHVYPCCSHPDFKNPNDSYGKTFDPHRTDYPVGELEFPNSGHRRERISLPMPLTSMVSGKPPSLGSPCTYFSQPLMIFPAHVSSNHYIRIVCSGLMARASRLYLISAPESRMRCCEYYQCAAPH